MNIQAVKSILDQAKHIVVLTGAGISRDSGIPTFRDDDGVWQKYPMHDFGTLPGLLRMAQKDPQKVAQFIVENYETFLCAHPNPGHKGVAGLQNSDKKVTVITQNIDNLHERAGSTEVIKLHGDMFRFRCLHCGFKIVAEKAEIKQRIQSLHNVCRVDKQTCAQALQESLPHCPDCNNFIRPDVVLYGEMLPESAWMMAQEAVQVCDIMLVVGTTAEVAPASTLPAMVARRKIPVVEVNPRPVLATATHQIANSASEVMPLLV